ncbi:cytochrome c biogenesis protein CcdA [Nanoarchaeota archaeon]
MRKILFLALFLVLASTVYAQNESVDIYYFAGQGCPNCVKMETFLEDIIEENPHVTVFKYEIYFDNNNRQLFYAMADAYGVDIEGVPTLFIDKKVFVGFSGTIATELYKEIERCSVESCISPADKVGGEDGVSQIVADASPERIEKLRALTLGAVIGAATVDAINPCAFAVLIILLTAILGASSKRRALGAGLAFTLAIFISYFLMGFGLYSAIQISGITHLFYAIVAVLAILVGLFNLKDYLWYGKWFVMEVPLSWRPKMKMLLKGVTSIPGAFLIGFVVSLFLLPCTSGPYIVILGLLAHTTTKATAIGWLLIYNLIFVIPMLVITALIYFGFTTTEKAEEWRQTKLKVLHLIAGIIILLLGIGMLVAMALGMI